MSRIVQASMHVRDQKSCCVLPVVLSRGKAELGAGAGWTPRLGSAPPGWNFFRGSEQDWEQILVTVCLCHVVRDRGEWTRESCAFISKLTLMV
jgi:hypothetical protein